jgi:hypothetical protein
MACPDELTLDLWLANALPSDQAAAVATHVRTCATCAAAERAAHALDAELHAALALDAEELGYVRRLNLVSTWRTSPAAQAVAWGWIALVCAVGGFAAWFVAAPLFASAIGAAVQVGVRSVLLHTALESAFFVGQALFDLARNPAFNLTQPLLALLALALLFWPRQLFPQRSTPS